MESRELMHDQIEHKKATYSTQTKSMKLHAMQR